MSILRSLLNFVMAEVAIDTYFTSLTFNLNNFFIHSYPNQLAYSSIITSYVKLATTLELDLIYKYKVNCFIGINHIYCNCSYLAMYKWTSPDHDHESPHHWYGTSYRIITLL